jgi:hypothetical protein
MKRKVGFLALFMVVAAGCGMPEGELPGGGATRADIKAKILQTGEYAVPTQFMRVRVKKVYYQATVTEPFKLNVAADGKFTVEGLPAVLRLHEVKPDDQVPPSQFTGVVDGAIAEVRFTNVPSGRFEIAAPDDHWVKNNRLGAALRDMSVEITVKVGKGKPEKLEKNKLVGGVDAETSNYDYNQFHMFEDDTTTYPPSPNFRWNFATARPIKVEYPAAVPPAKSGGRR